MVMGQITSSRRIQAAGAFANAGEIVPGPDINGTPIGSSPCRINRQGTSRQLITATRLTRRSREALTASTWPTTLSQPTASVDRLMSMAG